jgi:hypothetical protein
MSKMQFVIGAATGIGLSFSILQKITDRRLISFPKSDDVEKDAYRYEVLLWRRMWESGAPASSREFQVEKIVKKNWNNAIEEVPKMLSSASMFLTSKTGEIVGGKSVKEKSTK